MIPLNGVISEIWHAEKWRHGLDRHAMSPMYNDRAGDRHYYIDEVARLRTGQFVIPVRWLENESDGQVWCDAWPIELVDNCVCELLYKIHVKNSR